MASLVLNHFYQIQCFYIIFIKLSRIRILAQNMFCFDTVKKFPLFIDHTTLGEVQKN